MFWPRHDLPRNTGREEDGRDPFQKSLNGLLPAAGQDAALANKFNCLLVELEGGAAPGWWKFLYAIVRAAGQDLPPGVVFLSAAFMSAAFMSAAKALVRES